MVIRSAVLALIGIAALTGAAPPAMFSPWYAEALQDILKMEPADVARLEQTLAVNPDDFPARLKLMAYHRRADRAARQPDRDKRIHHTFWLIEHHPNSELLHSYVSRFSPGELTPGARWRYGMPRQPQRNPAQPCNGMQLRSSRTWTPHST